MKKIFTNTKLITLGLLAIVVIIAPKLVSAYTPVYYHYVIPYSVVEDPSKQILVTLTATPSSMTLPTNSTIINWKIPPISEPPTSCTGFGGSSSWPGAKSTTSGTQTITGLAVGTYTFGIICSKAGFTSAVSQVTVTVSPVVGTAVAAHIQAIPNTLPFGGGTSLIKWWSENATDCDGVNFDTGGAPSGTVNVNLTDTTVYKVACAGPGGSAAASTTVVVGPKDPSSIEVRLTPPSTVLAWPGGPFTLTWDSTNTTSCMSSSFDTGGERSGNVDLSIFSTTPSTSYVKNYSVTCTDGTSTGDAQAVVTVLPKNAVLGTCFDGIQNQDETGIDTGGVCGSGGPGGKPQCDDGVDNDDPEDKLADKYDPGCHTDGKVIPGDEEQKWDKLDNNERNGIKIKEKEI
jgi:hypothetical protein